MRNWMRSANTLINELVEASDVPPQVRAVTTTPIYPGILVQWRKTENARSYLIYRNTVADFATATLIQELTGQRNISFFDSRTATQFDSDQVLYYWVQARNSLGTVGVPSSVTTTENSVGPAPGLIPNGEEQSLWLMAYYDDTQDVQGLSTDVTPTSGAEVSQTFWGYSEGDDDDFTSSFEGISL